MMDERQRIVLKTFTKEQLAAMDPLDLVKLVGEAGPGAKMNGTGVVRKKDGSIRYDDDALPGSFGESESDLANHANSDT